METATLVKNKRFWIFWGGQSLSKIGDRLHYISLMWYVVQLTDSGTAMGQILLASSLPIVLLAPKAGDMIDRLNRKWVLIVADLLRAVAALGIGLLATAEQLNFPLLLILTALTAVGTTFFQPSVNALLPLIVRQEDLLRANSVNESSTQVAGMAGPVLAGIALSFLAPSIIFFLNALSFLIGALAALPLTVQPVEKKRIASGFQEGIRYLKTRPDLKDIALTFAVLNFAVSFMEVYIPFLSKDGLNGGSKELGLLFAAIFAGAFMASVGLVIKKEIHQWGKVIGGGIFLMGLSFASVFFLRQLLPVLVAFVCIGLGWGVFSTNARVYIQKTVENERRGRVFVINSAISNIMMPPAYALAGYATGFLPVYPAFFIGGSLVTLCGIYLFSRRFNYAECKCTPQPS